MTDTTKPDEITEKMVDAALAAGMNTLLDTRHPWHKEERETVRGMIRAGMDAVNWGNAGGLQLPAEKPAQESAALPDDSNMDSQSNIIKSELIEDLEQENAALRAELAALKKGDMVMVPRKPSEKMLAAFEKAWFYMPRYYVRSGNERITDGWNAMLAAAEEEERRG